MDETGPKSDELPEMDLSEAGEFLIFLATDTALDFYGITIDYSTLYKYAIAAFKVMGRKPGNFLDSLIRKKIAYAQEINKDKMVNRRNNQEMGPERGQILVNNFITGKENTFRGDTDDIFTIRKVLNYAASRVAYEKERATRITHQYIVQNCSKMLDDSYPLIDDEKRT